MPKEPRGSALDGSSWPVPSNLAHHACILGVGAPGHRQHRQALDGPQQALHDQRPLSVAESCPSRWAARQQARGAPLVHSDGRIGPVPPTASLPRQDGRHHATWMAGPATQRADHHGTTPVREPCGQGVLHHQAGHAAWHPAPSRRAARQQGERYHPAGLDRPGRTGRRKR